ncbi:MAG: hypothetical protein DRG31_06180, partial [Deltaproteobacteria bacterium]
GGSQDETLKIAKKFADKVISCKDISAADARNQGAKHAIGDFLLFVDADTYIPPKVLEKFLELADNDRVVGGSCRKIPKGGNILDRLLYEFVNLSTFICSIFKIGGAHGNCMFVKRSIFNKIGGFNPKIAVAEEQDLVRRARKFGKFVFLLGVSVVESPRRIRKWGRLKLYFTWFMGTFRVLLGRWGGNYEKVR